MNDSTLKKAVRVLNSGEGTVQMRMQFLRQQGLSEIDCMEALNEATNGELLRTALGNGGAEDE